MTPEPAQFYRARQRGAELARRCACMPHIEIEQAGHYAMAKIKEAVLAVTGG